MSEYNIANKISPAEIKKFRNRLDLTQKEFAELLGVSKPTVERMEKGDKEITGPIAALIDIATSNPGIMEERTVPPKVFPIRLWYMYKNKKCALIDVDEINRAIKIKNYERNIMYLPFGANNEPSYEEYEEFLKSRCFPETRDKIKIELSALNIPFYDPMMIIEKTGGRMAEDDFWIYIEK